MNSDSRIIWEQARNSLVSMIILLGFPEELGDMIARQLGSPKAIDRMTAYLEYERPSDERMIVDEMLAIAEQIQGWRDKKESEEAQFRYTQWLNSEERE